MLPSDKFSVRDAGINFAASEISQAVKIMKEKINSLNMEEEDSHYLIGKLSSILGNVELILHMEQHGKRQAHSRNTAVNRKLVQCSADREAASEKLAQLHGKLKALSYIPDEEAKIDTAQIASIECEIAETEKKLDTAIHTEIELRTKEGSVTETVTHAQAVDHTSATPPVTTTNPNYSYGGSSSSSSSSRPSYR